MVGVRGTYGSGAVLLVGVQGLRALQTVVAFAGTYRSGAVLLVGA